jgi:DNA-binding CsgD family transcriptional regulator
MPHETWVTLKKINVEIRNSALSVPERDEVSRSIPSADELQPFEKLIGQMKGLISDGTSGNALARLEQRLVAAEKQQDHLLYFIHFLYENFRELVREAMSEDQTIPKPETDKHTDTPTNSRRLPMITRRESEVLTMLGQGLSVKEIAQELFISENTVVTHKRNLKEKFGARNTPDLIAKFISHSSARS